MTVGHAMNVTNGYLVSSFYQVHGRKQKKKKKAINDLNHGKSWKNGFYQNHIFRLPQKSLYNKHD